jgi:Holliday junction DNA helicase RuvA
MITKLTGQLARVFDDRVRLQVGPLEYEVLVSELVRRQVQNRLEESITLHTSHYFEGNPMQGRMVPRLLGFLTEAELEFFELFCTVDKVGVRKALKALKMPVAQIADAIQRGDNKFLTTLPGVGNATAEQIVATLRRKVAKFALMVSASPVPSGSETAHGVVEDAFGALVSVGHGPAEAKAMIDRVLPRGPFDSVEALLQAIWQNR